MSPLDLGDAPATRLRQVERLGPMPLMPTMREAIQVRSDVAHAVGVLAVEDVFGGHAPSVQTRPLTSRG
jgi:hypothetical protein